MKLTNHKGLRASGMIGLLLIELFLMGLGRVAHSQTFSTTTVQGTVYLANGQPGTGTLVVSWPSFTTASGQLVAADSVAVAIAPDGFVSVNLAPNQGASPAGLYYTAIFYLSDGSVNTQYWLVPATASATLGQVQAQLMPSTQAIQAASKAYVDQAVASVTGSTLTASGGTLSGPLTLCCDPVTPLQAADKRYVDAASALAVPLTGGTLTGPLTATKLGALYQVDQLAGADFGAKLQACLSGLSSTNGGTCDARNFSGTLSMGANLTISTGNATVLLPCATISTANQLVVTAGTRNVSLRGCALRGASTASGSQGGTVFYYSGTGAMVQVGDPTYAADTLGFHLDNAVVNLTAATSASAQGFAAYRTQELDLESLYFLGNQNQTAMTLDGTGNYTGGTLYDNQFIGFQTAVNAIGHQITNPATTDWVNASTFVRLHIDCPTSGGSPISGTIGINLQQGDGNTFTGGDVEGCSTALHMGANAQNNTIVGMRNENSTNQVVADAGSSYNDWMTGGTMFSGKLTDNGTRNSFLDTFHRSFNGLNGDWYGSQADATVTNHYRLGTGAGNERGLLNEIQTDYGYRWVEGYTDATAGEQFYQVQDLLNNVSRISVGQYNNGQSSTNDQTVVNSAGTGAVVLNGSNNAGTGGVVIGSGGASETTVATISNAGNAQFNGSLQVGGSSTLAGTATVKNQSDAEIDATLWAGLTAAQNESFIYKNYLGASQWYMENHATNDWSLTSAVGGLDSFKAYQSTNSGDTYINTSNSAGVVRINYETGSGTQFKVYGGNSSTLYASFTGTTSIQFPGLAANSGHNCLQVDNSGYVTNTGSGCGAGSGSGSGTVNSGTSGQVAYYSGTGTVLSGTSAVSVTAGGTGASTASGALANLGGAALSGAMFTGPVTTPNMIAKGSPWFDVTGYGATGNAQKGIDGVTTANSATFTSASAPFNCSTDVGKVIQIQKGGAAGVPLLTTIAGCASASSITLATAASNAAPAQMFFWGTDDSAAFISARNAAGAFSGKVFVPTGIYLVSANPVITTNNDNPISIEGTCSFEGAHVLALGGASPYAACSTILDGSNNNTFQFNSAGNFRMKGLNFVSFPNSQGEFVLVAGTSNGSSETWNGIIEENAFWGKQYAAYGTHIIENIQFKGNSIGCASVGGFVLVEDISSGQNKNVFEDNYVDFQGACQALPTVGLQMTVSAGGGTITNASILRNEVQNSTASNATAIDCGGCVGFNITGNDIESSVGSSGWQYAITVEAENGVGSGAGTVGTNTIYTAFGMPSVLLLNVSNSFVAPQSIIAASTITNGVNLSGGGNNTVAPPSAVSGNITNLIAQTNGTAGNFITGGYVSVDSANDIVLSPASGSGILAKGFTYIAPSCTSGSCNSWTLGFQSLSSGTIVPGSMSYDTYGNFHVGMASPTFSLFDVNANIRTAQNFQNTNGVLLPSTLTGYHGTGAGDVKVQLSDGTGTSGYAAVYDSTGGLTNGYALATANTASAIAVRDSSGNFAAGTITAALTGNASTATNISTSGTANQVWGMNAGATAQGWQAASSGTVTTSGSPISPNAACFSSSTALTACTSANLQTAIGASVYDAAGAATSVQNASLQKSSNLGDLASAATALANLGMNETRTLHTSVLKGASCVAGATCTLLNVTGGPGTLTNIQFGTNGYSGSSASCTDGVLKITVDGVLRLSAPTGIIFGTYGNCAPAAAGVAPQVFASTKESLTTAMPGAFEGIVNWIIPYSSSILVTWTNSDTSNLAYVYSNLDYYSGAPPAGVYPPQMVYFNSYYTPPTTVAAGNSLPILPTTSGVGALESVQLYAQGITYNPAWMEGELSISADGNTYTYNGTEDFFCGSYYFSDLKGNISGSCGSSFIGPTLGGQYYGTGMFRFFDHGQSGTDNRQALFNSNLAVTWPNGSNMISQPVPATATSLVTFYTTTPMAATPIFSSAPGAIVPGTVVTASSTSSGAGCKIYFDTSNPPTTQQSTYTVTASTTLYAYVHGCSGLLDSVVSRVDYVTVPNPTVQYKICGDTNSSSGCTPSSTPAVYESMATGNNGTWAGAQRGTSHWYSTGNKLPYAGYFDGTDNAINAAATGLPTGTGQPVSMSAWVNYQGTNTAPYQIAEYGTNSTGRMFGAYVGYGYLTFGGNADDVTTPYLVPTDTWQHIVMTYDGTSIRAYVNGVLVWGPTAPPTPLNLSTAGLNIGGGSSNWFKGLIDDVRFYSTQLTQTQITALYNAGDTSFSVPTPNTVSQTVNTLSNNNGLILPSTLTGYHGTGAGDVKVQFSDGTGSSGHLATYDPNGGLTDGGAPGVGTVTTSGSPVSLNAACFSSSTAITACTSANLQTAIGASVYDVSGAATTAQSNAETYASNASNLSSGTVAAARLPAALANSTSVNGTTIPASATLLTTASTYSGTLTSSQVTTALTYTPANCTAGTSAGNCLTLNGSSLVPAGNLPAATPTAAGIVVKVANVSITVSSGTQGANSCSSATSVTMTGLTTSMVVTPGYSADPSTLTGWGSVGGMTFKAWPDSANTMKWRACNTTPASITYSTATFNVGAN